MRGALTRRGHRVPLPGRALPADHRTRAERDRIGREIWSRTLGDTELPLRAVHAAQSLGFLRPVPDVPVALLAVGPLAAAAHAVRLDRGPYGGDRRPQPLARLSVTPA